MFTNDLIPMVKNDLWADLFSNFDNLMNSTRFDFSQSFPAMNIYMNQDDKGFYLEMALVGYSKDTLNVEIDGSELTVSAKVPKNEDSDKEQRHYFKRRIQCQDFTRVYKIPEGYDTENIEVKFEDGLLTIFIPPKEEKSNVKRIEIK